MREREKEEDMNSGYEMSKEDEQEKMLRCISHYHISAPGQVKSQIVDNV